MARRNARARLRSVPEQLSWPGRGSARECRAEGEAWAARRRDLEGEGRPAVVFVFFFVVAAVAQKLAAIAGLSPCTCRRLASPWPLPSLCSPSLIAEIIAYLVVPRTSRTPHLHPTPEAALQWPASCPSWRFDVGLGESRRFC